MQRVHFDRTVQDLPQSPCGFKCAHSRWNYHKPTNTHLTWGLQGPQSACLCWKNIAALLPGWDSGGQQPVKTGNNMSIKTTTAQASIYHSQLQPPPKKSLNHVTICQLLSTIAPLYYCTVKKTKKQPWTSNVRKNKRIGIFRYRWSSQCLTKVISHFLVDFFPVTIREAIFLISSFCSLF